MGLGFFNATTWLAQDVPYVDPIGREVVIAIVKATFEISRDGVVVPAEEPSEIRLNDEVWDPEDERSSLRIPSDVAVEKKGTDVVVIGEAIAPKPVAEIDVAVRVGATTAPLRVHGPRFFHRGLAGVTIGPAAKVERVPLRYEKAFGGATPDGHTVEERNPSGLGVAAREADLIDTPAPQIEHPARPHKSARDRHPPMGYGAIMSHWLPRRRYAGTFDDRWKETRMPLLPADYDVRHGNVAHPALLFEAGVAPGTAISILGVGEGFFGFELPRLPVVVRALYAVSGRRTVCPSIDTVLVEPGRRRVEVVARCAFPIGRGRDVLGEVRVDVAQQ
jgi:hypothetical protein